MADRVTRLRTLAHRIAAEAGTTGARLERLGEQHAPLRLRVVPAETLEPDGDIATIAFTVVMETSRAAQDDVRSIVASMAALAKTRASAGALEMDRRSGGLDTDTALQLFVTAYCSDLDASIGRLFDDVDSLSELGEEQQLLLQMVLQRLAKTMSSLSNVLKKASDTSSQVIANLK